MRNAARVMMAAVPAMMLMKLGQAQAQGDVTVNSLSVSPGSFTYGSTLNFTANVRNCGDCGSPAQQTAYVAVWKAGADGQNYEARQFTSAKDLGALGNGERRKVSFSDSWTMPAEWKAQRVNAVMVGVGVTTDETDPSFTMRTFLYVRAADGSFYAAGTAPSPAGGNPRGRAVPNPSAMSWGGLKNMY